MPITYDLDSSTDVIVTRMTGVLTDDQVLAHMKALRADPRMHPGVRQLVDVRDVTDFKVTPEGIRMFTSLGRATPTGHRLAIVAVEDVTFGMARMYQMSRSDERVGVFRTMEEARDWLGLEPVD